MCYFPVCHFPNQLNWIIYQKHLEPQGAAYTWLVEALYSLKKKKLLLYPEGRRTHHISGNQIESLTQI